MKYDEQKNANGIVIAPAGCGKTENIINIIKKYDGNKKILVLTHTNAGIDNIEKRLRKNGNLDSKCNVYTIASFCLRYVKSYKILSKTIDDSYDSLYDGMCILLENNHIKKVLSNTYALMLVDEYQDCNLKQHNVIKKISKLIDFRVFGDPLQKIYDFRDECVELNSIINNDYPYLGYMNYPWRWEENKKLGSWIMYYRKKLENEETIGEISSLIPVVKYYEYSNINELKKIAFDMLKCEGSNVILFNIDNQAQSFCKLLGGKFFYQEEVECRTLKKIIKDIDDSKYNEILIEFINICKVSFTNFKTIYSNILSKIERNNYDFNKISKNKEEAQLIKSIHDDFDFIKLHQLINIIESNSEIKLYRKELWIVLKNIIKELIKDSNITALELLLSMRDSKNIKKYKYKNLVSRILLVKGLEFDNVLVINPKELTRELFYVAISRPTKHLIIAQKKY